MHIFTVCTILAISYSIFFIPSANASEIHLLSTKWSFGSSSDISSFFSSVAISKAGNIYTVDRDGSRVDEFTNNGILIKNWIFQDPLPGFPPNQIMATDSSNNVYVADDNRYIQEYTGDGTLITKWQPHDNSSLSIRPQSIALDSSGNIFISDTGRYIYKFSNNGTFILKWNARDDTCLVTSNTLKLIADPAGNIFAANGCNQNIKKFSQDGKLITQWGTIGSNAGQFRWMDYVGLATDSMGSVLVTDYDNQRVQKFTNDGTYITQMTIGNPIGITVDTSGNIYVIEQSNTVYKFVYTQTPIANEQIIPNSEDYPASFTLTGIVDKSQTQVFSIVDKPIHGIITGNPPNITYTPSRYYIGNDTFTFKITEGTRDSNIATITITNEAGKYTPIVNAGSNQIVKSGTSVNLDGSGSFDPDGEKISYSWLQTGGIPVTLSSNTSPKPSFTAPQVDSDTVLTFVLTVNDGTSNNSTSTIVTIKPSIVQSTPNPNTQNNTSAQSLVNQTNHSLQNNTSQQQITPQQTTSPNIPSWVKGNAKYWHDGSLGDDEFEKGVEYMIDNKIIKTDKKTQSNSGLKSIPKWVKSDAGWWADGTISQDDFLKGIEYMVEKGIINIQ